MTRLATVKCPTGLAFDIERQTCDWKTNVKNCEQLESKRKLYTPDQKKNTKIHFFFSEETRERKEPRKKRKKQAPIRDTVALKSILPPRCTRSGLKQITCPTGLAFDLDKQTCDWKGKVTNCDKLESK